MVLANGWWTSGHTENWREAYRLRNRKKKTSETKKDVDRRIHGANGGPFHEKNIGYVERAQKKCPPTPMVMKEGRGSKRKRRGWCVTVSF